jgi:hypothetical protein
MLSNVYDVEYLNLYIQFCVTSFKTLWRRAALCQFFEHFLSQCELRNFIEMKDYYNERFQLQNF